MVRDTAHTELAAKCKVKRFTWQTLSREVAGQYTNAVLKCRLRSEAAPIAGQVRHRLNRSGNRSLNSLVHRIVVTQSRCYAPARAYLARRQAEGKTRREAIRALKRFIVRAIWRLWQRCLAARASGPAGVSAA
jgi:hypothetical protein